MNTEQTAFIGVDAGGTKTAALLATADGTVIARKLSGPANYQSIGREGAKSSLRAAIAPLLAEAAQRGLTVVAFGFGVSGLDRPQDREAIREQVQPLVPDDVPFVLVNDTFCILRAGTPDGVGVAVVSGTGPNTVAWDATGREARIGGLGQEFGDYGGGSDIAATALAAARRGHDGRGPATALYDHLVEHLEVDDLVDIADWFFPDSPRAFHQASLAPLVFDVAARGDEVALGILRNAGQELGLCARLTAEKLFQSDEELHLVMGGSLLQRGRIPVMREAIVTAVSARFPHTMPVVLGVEPVCGGVLLAMDRHLGLRGENGRMRPGAALRPWPEAEVVARLSMAEEGDKQ